MKKMFLLVLFAANFVNVKSFCQDIHPFETFKNQEGPLYFPFPDPKDIYDDPFKEDEDDVLLIQVPNAKKTDEELILEKSLSLQDRLTLHIFGQENAIRETSNAILRYAAGVNDPNNPIACMLYCGPSGVGKTELVKQLCAELYGDMTRLIRINMSEYSEPHTISRLIGSPPGYVGYGEGGQLTNALLKNPYSIVLLDEVEKAHPKVLKLFLHAFDDGHISSATGKVVDCRKAIFILTSNLASMQIADLSGQGLSNDEIGEILKPYFMEELSPELYNRLDCIIFSPLSEKILEALINKMLKQLAERVNATKKIKLLFDESLINYFKHYCLLDPKLGARPLKRLIDKELATVAAKAIIQGKCVKDDILKCYYADGYVIVEKQKK